MLLCSTIRLQYSTMWSSSFFLSSGVQSLSFLFFKFLRQRCFSYNLSLFILYYCYGYILALLTYTVGSLKVWTIYNSLRIPSISLSNWAYSWWLHKRCWMHSSCTINASLMNALQIPIQRTFPHQEYLPLFYDYKNSSLSLNQIQCLLKRTHPKTITFLMS